jgi:hypothetical protein
MPQQWGQHERVAELLFTCCAWNSGIGGGGGRAGHCGPCKVSGICKGAKGSVCKATEQDQQTIRPHCCPEASAMESTYSPSPGRSQTVPYKLVGTQHPALAPKQVQDVMK